jgi:hypothetical protein
MPETDWNETVTLTMRRGDLAAVAQSLGYANNISDEAKQGKREIDAALAGPPATEEETVTLASGEPVQVHPAAKQATVERDVFAVLAGWNFEGDGEHRVTWDFERVKRQCVELQHEDAGKPPTSDQEEGDWPAELTVYKRKGFAGKPTLDRPGTGKAFAFFDFESRRYIPAPTSAPSVDVEEGER